MSDFEKYANLASQKNRAFDLVGAAIVFVFISGITVVTLMLVSWLVFAQTLYPDMQLILE